MIDVMRMFGIASCIQMGTGVHITVLSVCFFFLTCYRNSPTSSNEYVYSVAEGSLRLEDTDSNRDFGSYIGMQMTFCQINCYTSFLKKFFSFGLL